MKLTHKATAFAFAIMFTGQVFGATLPENITTLATSDVTTQNVAAMARAYRLAIISNKDASQDVKNLIVKDAKDFSRKILLTATDANDLAHLKTSTVRTYILGAISAYLHDFNAAQEIEASLNAQFPTFEAVVAAKPAVKVENVVQQNNVEIVEIDASDFATATPDKQEATPAGNDSVQAESNANLLQFIPLVDNFTSTTNVDTAAVDSVVKPNVTTSIEEDDDYAKAVLADVAAQIEAEKEAAAKLANQPESEFVQAVLADFTAQTEVEQAIVQAKEDREKAQQKAAQEAAERAQAPFLSTNKAIALSAGMVGATVYALDGGARILNLDTNGNGVSDIDEAYNALVTADLNGNGVADVTEIKDAVDNAYNTAYNTFVTADLNGNGVADVTEIQNAALAAQDGVVDTYNSAYEAAVAAKEAVMYELGKGTLPTSRADALAKQARENEAKRIAAEELARQEELARIAALEQAAREKANSAGCVSWIRSWFNDCPVQK